ncbi:PAS domain S-box protein [bacterium]|nr:MAG: PAS domain S-box protein [bacterium]
MQNPLTLTEEASVPAGDMNKLLSYLKGARGFDFNAYKRTTLQRRVQKRMALVGSATYEEYIDFLEVHPDEFPQLFNTILINVTSFFRDMESWDYIRDTVIPRILESKEEREPIRIWGAGCASGEEACTVAILLAEALGTTAFRERVKIYATDLDDDALNQSRMASYTEREVEGVPPEFLKKYFERIQDRYVFDRELRRSVIFGKHDLIQDAPISRVDLLLCRNTLMYFNAETQERILARFHFALNDGGFLFLGKAETLLTHTSTFAPLDMKNRVFTKVSRSRMRDRALYLPPLRREEPSLAENDLRLRESALDTAPVALIAVDPLGKIHLVNERARSTFGLGPRDIGRPIQDIELSYRPVELRSGIEQAQLGRRPVVYKDVQWITPGGDAATFVVTVTPLYAERNELLGTRITFEDVTQFKRLQGELVNFNQELETAYEEVQSTNEELQTTNEELQSTVEELETTNEELQSTNEELETMNEELQSANEELETINEELRDRSTDLNRANLFLHSVLASLRDAVIVVDSNNVILAWNGRSEDLWGLRTDEVQGKHLMNLDIGLPLGEFREPIRQCLATGENQEKTVEATNRRGKRVRCDLAFTPLLGLEAEQRGVIIMTTCVLA